MANTCNDCFITLQDVTKGAPHSPVILPKYQEPESKQNNIQLTYHQKYHTKCKIVSGKLSQNMSDYFNGEHLPLVDAYGPVINFTSVAPLHIS